MKLHLSDFSVGDVVEFTQRLRHNGAVREELRYAEVTAVNYNGLGLVTFTGHYADGKLPSGSGAFDPERVGAHPFGFYCAVRKVGRIAPWRPFSPRPGDSAYDPVH